MNITPMSESFAFLLAPFNIELVQDEIYPDVWSRSREVFEALAAIPFKGRADVGSFYIVFADPTDRGSIKLMHADQLYARYNTKFYNEEILLIAPKQ